MTKESPNTQCKATALVISQVQSSIFMLANALASSLRTHFHHHCAII